MVTMQADGVHAVHVDADILVLGKPAGLLTVPGRGPDKQDCLSARAQHRWPGALVVHRLDMATSGLVLMARHIQAQRSLSQAFADRQVHKRYVAVVSGLLVQPVASDAWSEIELPIAVDWPRRPMRVVDPQGKPSTTRWRPVSHDGEAQTTRIELEPLTGRTHQLRVHLQALGHPIVGDALYGPPEVASRMPRLLLHAAELAFQHPVTGALQRFHLPPPF
jgi:tRNA pseudouridine32 synthase / 23S rRNA pseudouridine746 synthase